MLATPLPWPLGAVFLVMVECSITLRPAKLMTPPPVSVAELALMVELVMVVFCVPERKVSEKAPPPKPAELPEMVESLTVRMPSRLWMPPPVKAVARLSGHTYCSHLPY
jgi:hypothetical protein